MRRSEKQTAHLTFQILNRLLSLQQSKRETPIAYRITRRASSGFEKENTIIGIRLSDKIMPVLRTPTNKLVYLLLLNLSWFGNMPGIAEYYQFCLERGDYPIHADSIGIPIFQSAVGLIVLAPILSLGAYLLLRRSKLPAPLLVPFTEQPTDFVACVVCLLMSCFMVYDWVCLVCDVAPAGWLRLPSLVLAMYLVWSTRAGLLNCANET